MKQKTIIFWFRRDLRLYDNHGLFKALKQELPVLPVFIFDTHFIKRIVSKSDARVTFVHTQVQNLKQELEKQGSSLKVFHDTAKGAFTELLNEFEVTSVYANKEYEPYTRQRDEKINQLLQSRGIGFFLFKDHVVMEEDEVLNSSGGPYTVFTPYSRKWKKNLFENPLASFDSEKLQEKFLKIHSLHMPSLEDIGFIKSFVSILPPEIPEDIIRNYAITRDFPSVHGTTRLGIHLRYGTISIRELVSKAVSFSDVFLNELIWRDFFSSILWHFPWVSERSFKVKYDDIQWRNNEQEFERWCNGETGFAMVDAGMRELSATGFMHNRLRMITAGFLTKHLLIDWRWGETWFAEKLLDYELSSNNGNWQWAAGSGCDAVPWFRIFNPEIQQKKFDPKEEYIRKWVPEWGTLGYPAPMVDHKMARERALQVYQKALR